MIHQLHIRDWVVNGSEIAICQLPLTVAQAEKHFGLTFTQCEPDKPEQWHAVVEHDGQVYLLHAVREGIPPHSQIEVIARGDILNPEPLVEKICSAFRLRPQALPWVSNDLGARPWALWRLDDNNNRSVMWYFKEKSDAERVAKIYTERGHKQLYYVDTALSQVAPVR